MVVDALIPATQKVEAGESLEPRSSDLSNTVRSYFIKTKKVVPSLFYPT
jgi:hypothetical protein